MSINSLDIIIIGYNEAPNLPRTITAAVKAARQLENDLNFSTRVVYIDSNSTDNSFEIASAHGIEAFYANPDFKSVGNGRHSGYLLTDSEYIMFLDGDCELHQQWLVEGVKFLAEFPQAGGAIGKETKIRFFGDKMVPVENIGKIPDKPIFVKPTCITGSGLYRREAVDSSGGIEPDIESSEDRLLNFQLHVNGWPVYEIPIQMITHWDIHLQSVKNGFLRFKRMLYRASTLGALLRYGIKNPALLGFIIKSLLPEVFHFLYLVISLILLGIGWQNHNTNYLLYWLALTLMYYVYQSIRKRSLVYGASAIILLTAYVFEIIFAAVFNFPNLQWGIQNTTAYQQRVFEINHIQNDTKNK